MSGVYIQDFSLINALGDSRCDMRERLMRGDASRMRVESGLLLDKAALVGRVSLSLPALPAALADMDSRNNRLLVAAFEPLRASYERCLAGVDRSRVGIVLGSSTSGIAETETALETLSATGAFPMDYHYHQQEMGSPAECLARYLGMTGIAYTVSTACTSSGKAMVSAAMLLKSGLCDVVITGGVDTLCRLTLNGFDSLESISPSLCQPFSRNRRGINIGEGAALFLLSRQPSGIELAGYGESSDAWHLSAPQPQGLGAEAAMLGAMAMAGVGPEAVAYVNLHGTATVKNDEMESLAMSRVFPAGVPCSSTKPLVGHTLGAAAATELGFCCLALQDDLGRLPPHIWDGERQEDLPLLDLVAAGRLRDGGKAAYMSNSYAFGGNNVSLLVRATGRPKDGQVK